jgi:hypothetical protein
MGMVLVLVLERGKNQKRPLKTELNPSPIEKKKTFKIV